MLYPALGPALDEEVSALSICRKLDVMAMRPLCCHAHTMELSMSVMGVLIQELFAHRQVKYLYYTSIKKDFMEIKRM